MFRDSLNYFHIARGLKGGGRGDETAGIDYTRYGNSGQTAQLSVDITGWWVPWPDL